MTSTSEMQHFLQNLISTTVSAKPEKNTISLRIKDIEKNIQILKKDVCETMLSQYRSFEKFEASDRKVFEKCLQTVEEMAELSDKIENEVKSELASSTQELNKLKESLLETSLSLSLVDQLIKIKNSVDESNKALYEGRYIAAANYMQKAKDMLDNPKEKANLLHIFGSMREHWSEQHANLMQILYDAWGNFFSWEENEITPDKKIINFKILRTDMSHLKDVVEAYHQLFESSFYRFGKNLLHNIFIPVITHTTEVNIFQNETHVSLSIEIDLLMSKPDVATIINNVTKVNEFLLRELSVPMENGDSFLNLLGSVISKEFSDLFIKECLMNTLPSSRQEMNYYSETLGQLKKFANDLNTTGFLEAGGIFEYISKADVLSVEKSCAVFLERARIIMKKDLHSAVTIEQNSPFVSLDSIMPKALDQLALNNRADLPVDLRQMFVFPSCRVSKWTLDLMTLVEEILNESLLHDEEERWPFYQTARNVFVLYLSVVPVYHQKLLEKIPQLVALFHNNSIYLAHRLLTLGFEYQPYLPQSRKNQLIFVDLVQPLRNLGTDAFLVLLQEQRRALLDLTKVSGLASIWERPDLPPTVEESIRKCLRLLEHLDSVWKDVLPAEVYNKSIGGLLDAWLEDIIARVCTAEDISDSAVQKLISVFTIIVHRGPKVFKVENEVRKHVKNWGKFTELIRLLGSHLKDIEERWMQGVGVLAHEFSAEQVKHLIRALFQNTEVRAAVLSRIE